ncbi:MAG: hypothetical protein GY776_09985 [Alteromonas sp.]|nr:hypothetical protein [Alteromonas sp.]
MHVDGRRQISHVLNQLAARIMRLLLLLRRRRRRKGIALEQTMRLSDVECARFVVKRWSCYGAYQRAKHLAQQSEEHPHARNLRQLHDTLKCFEGVTAMMSRY